MEIPCLPTSHPCGTHPLIEGTTPLHQQEPLTTIRSAIGVIDRGNLKHGTNDDCSVRREFPFYTPHFLGLGMDVFQDQLFNQKLKATAFKPRLKIRNRFVHSDIPKHSPSWRRIQGTISAQTDKTQIRRPAARYD
jgi:hypothetical protein